MPNEYLSEFCFLPLKQCLSNKQSNSKHLLIACNVPDVILHARYTTDKGNHSCLQGDSIPLEETPHTYRSLYKVNAMYLGGSTNTWGSQEKLIVEGSS